MATAGLWERGAKSESLQKSQVMDLTAGGQTTVCRGPACQGSIGANRRHKGRSGQASQTLTAHSAKLHVGPVDTDYRVNPGQPKKLHHLRVEVQCPGTRGLFFLGSIILNIFGLLWGLKRPLGKDQVLPRQPSAGGNSGNTIDLSLGRNDRASGAAPGGAGVFPAPRHLWLTRLPP
jgi:hypothetical protein